MYIKEKGRITNKEYRELTQLSDEGVRKDLNELVEKGVLQSQGNSRTQVVSSLSYYVGIKAYIWSLPTYPSR